MAVYVITGSRITNVAVKEKSYKSDVLKAKSMLPQFELQHKRRMHAKRHRDEQRKRVVLILCSVTCCLALLIVFNVYYIYRNAPKVSDYKDNVSGGSTRGGVRKREIWIDRDAQPFNQDQKATKSHHLIMVAGHSVTVSGDLQDADHDEKDWFLLEYQKGKGLPETIVGHIKRGIDEADKDPDSLLIFSGGETRAATGPITEATSYFNVADAMKLWPEGKASSVRARTVTEEFATDSFQNLMFSICRFREVTGNYPTKITVISFTFKEWRFENLHATALGWPLEKFNYIGVDPPSSTGFDLEASTRGEQENAAKPFEKDPYGCHTPVLQEKRKARNPFSRTPPYELTCPEMKSLLKYCGPKLFPKEELPWGTTAD